MTLLLPHYQIQWSTPRLDWALGIAIYNLGFPVIRSPLFKMYLFLLCLIMCKCMYLHVGMYM